MASVIKRGSKWYVKFRNAAGAVERSPTSARTRREAQRFADSLELKAERQRRGLEPLLEDAAGTFGELCRWWLEHRCPEPSRYIEGKRFGASVLAHPAAELPLAAVSSDVIEQVLEAYEAAGAGPASFNKLRGMLHSVFSKAIKAKKWFLANPVEAVETRHVAKRAYVTLTTDEVPVLLAWVPLEWRNLFAAALYLALRKGELCGLKKSDVNLAQRTVLVARSYANETTKGKRTDLLPIAEPLVPYLEDALARTPGQWLFPMPDGSMRTDDSAPEFVLRTAMKNAGIVDGYEHTCRRCKAAGKPEVEHTTRKTDSLPGKCAACGMALWVKPVPRTVDGNEMRFHDCRHSTATILLRAGVEPHRVQRILRHANLNTTLSIYGHLNTEDLRAAVNRITPERAEAVEAAAATGTDAAQLPSAPQGGRGHSPDAAVARLGPTEVQTPVAAPQRTHAGTESARRHATLRRAEKGTRTLDPCLGKASGPVATGVDGALSARNESSADSIGGDAFHAPVAEEGPIEVQRPALRVLAGGRGALERLMKVPEVAELLGVSAATVYGLVERGELAHVRVSASIRFEASVVDTFVATRSRR